MSCCRVKYNSWDNYFINRTFFFAPAAEKRKKMKRKQNLLQRRITKISSRQVIERKKYSEEKITIKAKIETFFQKEQCLGWPSQKQIPLPGGTAICLLCATESARTFSLVRQTIIWYAVERLALRGDRKSSKCGVASIHHFSPVFIRSDDELCRFETPWFHWGKSRSAACGG